MLKSLILLMMGVVLLSISSGCARLEAEEKSIQLQDLTRAYRKAIRWSEFEVAKNYIRHRDGSVFRYDKAFFESIKVTSMEISKRDVSIDFLSVSSYGNSTRSSRNPKIQQDLTCEISGLDVVLVEDIVDTGTPLKHIYDVLEQRTPPSLRTVALLDKPSRRVTQISHSYVGFKISDKFVVGYGLDYSPHFRNRPDISS